jgi:muramoyltetrapeptide carboxypeptidase
MNGGWTLDAAPLLRPPRLRPGARIALVSPAGPSTPERIDAAVERCRHLGFEPVLGRHAARRTGYLAGRDQERLEDLARALREPGIDAVWAIRGGYGTLRILPEFAAGLDGCPPRAYIGFSDNTALHLALARTGRVAFHGPHAGADEFPPLAEQCFRRVLCDGAPAGTLPPDPATPPRTLRGGRARGRLLGGNLSLLAATCGTRFAPRAAGAILFLEEVGEPAYRVDRLLRQLALAGVLDGVAGVAGGRFTDVEADDRPALDALLAEWAEALGVPAVVGLPIGHVGENWTLPLGVAAELDADAATLALLEPAVD